MGRHFVLKTAFRVQDIMIFTLIGFMGCGKSSIGKHIAGKLGCDFADSDILVEKGEGMTVTEIFSRYGETGFREIEYRYIDRTVRSYGGRADWKRDGDGKAKSLIFALGGGAVTYKATATLIKERTFPIYIKCSPEELIANLKEDGTAGRPMLAGYDLETRVRQLLSEREAAYGNCARLIVSPSGLEEAIVKGLSPIR